MGILVTGPAGFSGSRSARSLLDGGLPCLLTTGGTLTTPGTLTAGITRKARAAR